MSRLGLPRVAPSATRALRSSIARRAYSTPVDLAPSSTRITTLPNKVRVATEDSPGHFNAVGVYVDAGSRYESPLFSGVSHLVDRLAFKSTTNRTDADMTTAISALGGNIMCSSSRETIMYQSSIFSQDLPAALSLLSDTILNPSLAPEEIDTQREAAEYEISEIWGKPEMILPELLHHVAFQGNTLGNPLLCPIERLGDIDEHVVRDYMRTWYRPERIVVAGAGMPHEELVELTEKLFGQMRASEPTFSPSELLAASKQACSTSPCASNIPPHLLPPSSPPPKSSLYKSLTTAASSLLHPSAGSPPPPAPSRSLETFEELAAARARYTGGELYLDKPEMDFTHVYIGFEGLGIHDDDVYALATLQMLLGGGGSFSAGGPGKGMYSRLYTHVLNLHHSIDFCASFHHCYADSGLFGLSAAVHPSYNRRISDILARELHLLTQPPHLGGVNPVELSRAKNQLKSSLVMALESRLVEVEDLGRQVQVHGRKVPVDEMARRIDEINVDGIRRVAQRVLRPRKGDLNAGEGSGEPTVVVQGKLDGIGNVRQRLRSYGLGVVQ